MDFSGQYLTYEEFKRLGDTTIDLMSFNLLEFESRRKIDVRTQNRLKNVSSEEIPQEVKLCEYKLINSINEYVKSVDEINNIGNKASESTDGYSVSYLTADKISEVMLSKNKQLDDIIDTYLMGVVVNGEHIMYLGVC